MKRTGHTPHWSVSGFGNVSDYGYDDDTFLSLMSPVVQRGNAKLYVRYQFGICFKTRTKFETPHSLTLHKRYIIKRWYIGLIHAYLTRQKSTASTNLSL